jgi:hypothetical protein
MKKFMQKIYPKPPVLSIEATWASTRNPGATTLHAPNIFNTSQPASGRIRLRRGVEANEHYLQAKRDDSIGGRPSLKRLFSDTRGKISRDPIIVKAITDYGYSQMEVASFLGLHYSTISRIVADVGGTAKVKT